jgi:hypothetical protein
VVEFLFQSGARCDVRNDKGETPLDLAQTDELFSKLKFILEIDETRAALQQTEFEIQNIKAKREAEEEARAQAMTLSKARTGTFRSWDRNPGGTMASKGTVTR